MPRKSRSASKGNGGGDGLFPPDYLIDAKGDSELTKRLKEVHEVLRDIPQPEKGPGAQLPDLSIAKDLVDSRVLMNRDKVS